jgi:hypothetical protein
MTALAKRSLPTLAGQIRREHEAVEAGVRATVEAAIRCGELLAEAKQRVGHGGWYGLLGQNFPSTPQTAAGYMRLAAMRAFDLAAVGSIRGALKQLAAPSTNGGANTVSGPPSPDADLDESWHSFTEPQRLHLYHLAQGVEGRATELECRARANPEFGRLMELEATITRAMGRQELYAHAALYELEHAPQDDPETARLRARAYEVLAELAHEAAMAAR